MKRPGTEAERRYPSSEISIRGLVNSYRVGPEEKGQQRVVKQDPLTSFANSQVGELLRWAPPIRRRYTPSTNATRMLH